MVQTGRSPTILAPERDSSPSPTNNVRHAATIVVFGYVALTLAVVVIGFLITHPLDGSVGRWDTSVNHWLADHRIGAWNRVTSIATWFINTFQAIGLAAVITAVLAFRHRWREAALLVIALSLEVAVFLSANRIVGRPRPDVVRLNETPSTSSFPSGHVAAATVIFVGFAIIVTCLTRNAVARRFAFAVAVALSALVGFARTYRGMHHPSDVIVGAAMGAACLLVAVLAVRSVPPQPADVPRASDETGSRVVSSTAA